jgi:hypothetical protein
LLEVLLFAKFIKWQPVKGEYELANTLPFTTNFVLVSNKSVEILNASGVIVLIPTLPVPKSPPNNGF